MNITTKSRYALRAVVDIALHQGQAGYPVRRMDIGEREDFSQDYLEQLLVKLREAGLVQAVRGPGGGYRLAKSPENITVWDIVRTVETKLHYAPCNGANVADCERYDICQCRYVWFKLKRTVHDELSSITIADIMSGRILAGLDGYVDDDDLTLNEPEGEAVR